MRSHPVMQRLAGKGLTPGGLFSEQFGAARKIRRRQAAFRSASSRPFMKSARRATFQALTSRMAARWRDAGVAGGMEAAERSLEGAVRDGFEEDMRADAEDAGDVGASVRDGAGPIREPAPRFFFSDDGRGLDHVVEEDVVGDDGARKAASLRASSAPKSAVARATLASSSREPVARWRLGSAARMGTGRALARNRAAPSAPSA